MSVDIAEFSACRGTHRHCEHESSQHPPGGSGRGVHIGGDVRKCSCDQGHQRTESENCQSNHPKQHPPVGGVLRRLLSYRLWWSDTPDIGLICRSSDTHSAQVCRVKPVFLHILRFLAVLRILYVSTGSVFGLRPSLDSG